MINPKKPIRIQNNTKYFIPGKDKVTVQFSSPSSYNFRKSKIEGYENRLYWHYKYCESVNGQTFFYTLTYNDNKIPHHYGINCFDYEDLRELLTGGFRKVLLRKYATVFKYFIGAELGDGKGERGFHNNPHYHVLFFLEPSPNKVFRHVNAKIPIGFYQKNFNGHKKGDIRYKTKRIKLEVPYTKISPESFRTLVKRYWQGFDENVDGHQDFRNSYFGIAKEGRNIGLVDEFSACMYCAKYVCKDVALIDNESKVESSLILKFRDEFNDNEEVYKSFYRSYIFHTFNVPLDSKSLKWCYGDMDLFERFFPQSVKQINLFEVSPTPYKEMVIKFCNEYGLWTAYKDYLNSFIDEKVHEGLQEYRNRFCNKCRISHGVGDFALANLTDVNNPTIKVPSKKGFKERPIGLYYYRKLFCDVVKDSKGSNLYLLNDKGISYKTRMLPEMLQKKMDSARSCFDLLVSSSVLYDKMLDSDVNEDVSMLYSEFLRQINKINPNTLLKTYAEYKIIYEGRFFPFHIHGEGCSNTFPSIDIVNDYRRFLVPSFYSVSRSDLRLSAFVQSCFEGYLSYRAHPYFLPYVSLFNVLDLCSDYLFVQKDDKLQREAEEIARVKRFHKCRELKDYYKSLVKS